MDKRFLDNELTGKVGSFVGIGNPFDLWGRFETAGSGRNLALQW